MPNGQVTSDPFATHVDPTPLVAAPPAVPEAAAISVEENALAMVGDTDVETCVAPEASWRTPNGDAVAVKAVKAMALWSLRVGLHETCPICRESLQAPCVQCLATGAADERSDAAAGGGCGDECRVAQLPCGHLFHYHCVSGWLRSRDEPCCPSCQAVVYSTEDIQFL